MCLVCSYKAFAGQAEVPYFDIVDAIWANAYEYVVRLEIAVDNVQAFEHTELVVSQFQTRTGTTYLCTCTSPCSI